jgi:iron complex transport system ATP-binding protein
MSVIVLQQVSTGYRHGRTTRTLLTRLDATLEAGRLTVLVGPNGAGKSTLIRTMTGLQPALAGRVLLDGEDLHTMSPRLRAQRLAVVLTQQIRMWGLTARQLVALGRHPHTGVTGTLTTRDYEVVDRALEATGSGVLAHRQIAELSDGERQRVMVARALAQEPRAMVLDEVTAFLDLPHRVDILLLVRRLARESGCALLLSTHDLELALKIADTLWVIDSGSVFSAGAPGALADAGVLDTVFASEQLVFNRQRRQFEVTHALD